MCLKGPVRHRRMATFECLHAYAISLRELYSRAQRQQQSCDLHELRLLLGRHCDEQATLAELLRGRVRALGGPERELAGHAACTPRDDELTDTELKHLLEAHGLVLSSIEPLIRQVTLDGSEVDELIFDEFVRTNERQCWLVAEHLVMR
jgi:hypothetical protein